MPKYQDIFDPEIIAKLKAKSSEKIRGKSLMQMMRSSQELLSLVVSIEAPYKSQLSQLAIDIVKDHYPTLVEDNIDVEARIVSNVTLEEYNPYEKQRRISNALVQGASVEELYSLFEKESVIQQIRSINSTLYDKYNELMKQVFDIYNDDQAINMMLAAIASGQNLAGGKSQIVTENEGPKIIAEAICFPMLVHEILKGYWSILAQTGLKGSDEEAQATVDRVDRLEYEPEDIRYGPIIFNKLKTIYKAFTSPDVDVRTLVVFYTAILQMEPDEFFSFISNVVGDRPLSEDQIAWIENELEDIQVYLQTIDAERAMSSFSNNDEDNIDDVDLSDLGLNEKKRPYKDLETTDKYILREFNENIDPIELKWHRDKENRIIEIVGKTNWKIQLENQLPVSINQPIRIPKGEWHRLIKGDGTLTLKILKEESTQYNMEGILYTDTRERPQKDILSDIRSLPGVTIVSSKDINPNVYATNNPNYGTIIKIKVDPHPYPSGFKDEDLQQLLQDIRAVKGVRNFKLNQKVEKKTV